MAEKSKKSSAVLHIATPFVVAAIAVGGVIAAAVKPSDKLKVYLNVAFMDDLKTDPENASSGLIIRDKEIVEDHSGETSDTGELIRPKFGEKYAEIRSSVLSLDVPVYWGSDVDLFERGACQSTGSVLAGDKGNSVISAHEDTFFSELKKFRAGDTITLYTNYGYFTYKVRECVTFTKDTNKYIVPSKDDRLTLYTCKKDVLGRSDERIGVICDLTEKKFYIGAEGGNAE